MQFKICVFIKKSFYVQNKEKRLRMRVNEIRCTTTKMLEGGLTGKYHEKRIKPKGYR